MSQPTAYDSTTGKNSTIMVVIAASLVIIAGVLAWVHIISPMLREPAQKAAKPAAAVGVVLPVPDEVRWKVTDAFGEQGVSDKWAVADPEWRWNGVDTVSMTGDFVHSEDSSRDGRATLLAYLKLDGSIEFGEPTPVGPE